MLDLAYDEDSVADMDLNVVASASGGVVELQATAEDAPIPKEHVDGLVELALGGVRRLASAQREALVRAGVDVDSLREPRPAA
jgi:ribonuclease PH